MVYTILTVVLLGLNTEPHDLTAEFAGQVPADAIAVFMLGATASGIAPSATGQSFSGISDRLRDMGILKESDALVWLDLLNTLGMLRRWPTAWILHDMRFDSLPNGSSQLAQLHASVVIADGEDHSAIADRIRHFLRRYTSDRSARIESWELSGQRFYRLVDERLPEWAVFEWGPLGNRYTFSVGLGCSARLAHTAEASELSLLNESFFASAVEQLDTSASGALLYGNLQKARTVLDTIAVRAAAVSRALGLQRADQLLWNLRHEQRAVIIDQLLRAGGVDQRDALSRPADRQMPWVPGDATWYSVLEVCPRDIMLLVRDTYLAWHRSETQLRLREGWAALARDRQINFEQEVLAQLGDHIIIHDAPRHPLGLPGMVTILIEIDGDPKTIYNTLNETFEYLAIRLDAAAFRSNSVFAPRLRQNIHGLWYTQAGVLGPALAVTEEYVIISYSLPALQYSLEPPKSKNRAALSPEDNTVRIPAPTTSAP